MSHHLATAVRDMQQSAAFAPVGLLHVPLCTRPRPSGRKHHTSQQLSGLATKAGEICGFDGFPLLPRKPTAISALPLDMRRYTIHIV